MVFGHCRDDYAQRQDGSHSSVFECSGVIEAPVRIGQSQTKLATARR